MLFFYLLAVYLALERDSLLFDGYIPFKLPVQKLHGSSAI